MKQFKIKCIACNSSSIKMNKEHFWPQWLIERTGTAKGLIKWIDEKRIPPLAGTIPICTKCNAGFGKELERPVSRIFDDLLNGRGLSDSDAELLVRWLWKFEGFLWRLAVPGGEYTENYTLKERVLRPIDQVRDSLVLAISLIEMNDPGESDYPMGFDSFNLHNAIFVSGVFHKIAIMSLHNLLAGELSDRFSKYRLLPLKGPTSEAKLFYPKVGFRYCSEAVLFMHQSAPYLAKLHDGMAIEMQKCARQLTEG